MKDLSTDYCLDLTIYPISSGEESVPEYDVHCPLLVTVKNNTNILNWNSEWCKLRLERNSICSRKCPVANYIKRQKAKKDVEK